MAIGANNDPEEGALRLPTGLTADPTPRTTQQVLRENFWLRELLEAKLQAIESRMDQGDKAVKLLQAFADRTPTTMDVQHQVLQLREVVMQMFSQGDKAVAAAFAASKEAVGEQNRYSALAITKSEVAVKEQLNQMTETNKTNTKSLEDKIDDLKDRMTKLESRGAIMDPSISAGLSSIMGRLGQVEATLNTTGGRTAQAKDNTATIISIVAAIAAVGAIFVGLKF